MWVRARGLCALAAVCVASAIGGLAAPGYAEPTPGAEPAAVAPGAEQAAREILVVVGQVDGELAPLATGAAELVRLRMEGLGVPVRERSRALPAGGAAARGSATRDALQLAEQSQAAGVLLVDLGLRGGELELVLRYCDRARGALAATGRARGAPGDWAVLRDRALEGLRSALSIGELPRASQSPLGIEDLAAASSALAALDRGALARAWGELASRRAAALDGIREQIRQAGRDPGIGYPERVRLLAALGEAERAWSMLSQRAELELEKPQPDAALLLTAGEVELARGEVDPARRFFERAAGSAAPSSDAELGLGAAQALQGDAEHARSAFERASALEPTRLEPLARRAQLPSPDPALRARGWLEAGQRAAEQLRVESADAWLARAREPQAPHELAARSFEVAARLDVRMGDAREAARQWEQALAVGGASAERLIGLGEAQRSLGELPRAVATLQQALALAPQRPETLRVLGETEVAKGELDSAVAHLERARELAPDDARAVRALARARLAGGDAPHALHLFREAERMQAGGVPELRELGAVELAHGESAAAVLVLERATQLAPADAELHAELARAYRELGQPEAAQKVDSVVLILGGAQYGKLFPEDKPQRAADSPSLERLAASLLDAEPRVRRVSVLGVRESRSRRDELLDWLRPRVPDPRSLARGLERAFAGRVELVPAQAPAAQELFYAQALDRLHQFGDPDASTIATLNTLLESDAIAVARIERHGVDPAASERPCGMEAHLRIDARLLAGRIANDVRALENGACLPAGAWSNERWNPRALAVYLLGIAALCFRFARGWGSVVVQFQLPDNTRAMFSVSVTRRRRNRARKAGSEENRWRIREKLLSMHRAEKRLDGTRLVFHWLTARRRAYYVTVRGPLVDHLSGDLVGSFNAEKTVVVQRGKTAQVEFDMRAKDACIEVNVVAMGIRVGEATVCVRGVPKSQRFARGKPAYLYLPIGEYVIVAGAGEKVSELPISIERELPQSVAIDLSEPSTQLFSGCPAAVAPYLEGDYALAATELERRGLRETAQKVRALDQLARGETQAAAQSLVEGGDLARAAELELARGGDAEAARLFEESGEYARAAEIYVRQGNKRAAARAFERAYDYDAAALCHRETGDLESLATVLEKSGDVYEAGRVACALEQWERAIRDLQEVDRRHSHYTEACLILGEILVERGERDLALERFDEAMSRASAEGPELAQQARYAELLEEAGRISDAIDVYNRIRRRDRNYPGARERAEELRKQLSDAAAAQAGGATQVTNNPPPLAANRYEIVGELGRGAMGIVYKARDTVLDRMVALKKLPESMRQHELAVRFFLREARSAAALNHPNIVTVYDAGQDGDTYFLTMECLEGTTLDGILRRNRVLSARDTCLLGIQAATGLAYAHAGGIIHRDIKPSNLFYTRDRIVKIMDFGLAKAVEEVRRNATVIAGTPYYMPPEQAEGGMVDPRSDLYALGVTLFHLCTGRVPFGEGDVAYHHRHTPAPDPCERVPEIPAALGELIRQLLEKDPEQRPAAADEVVARLKSIAQTLTQR